jgi:hypothetical protein
LGALRSNKQARWRIRFAKIFHNQHFALLAAATFFEQRHWLMFSMDSLPQLLLQCCQFAVLPGAAQDSIVGGCDTPNLFTSRQAWFRYLLYRNVSTDFFALIKRFLEIYANERNQRNRTEAAVGFVQHRFGNMAAEVLRLNISARFKSCIFIELLC